MPEASSETDINLPSKKPVSTSKIYYKSKKVKFSRGDLPGMRQRRVYEAVLPENYSY
ncbi:hypothetical protein [uncultured Campylobacter sp.]|uniref:hypothetical protein n=1 Tax=uncultured Campylobacter sp. TaxID=218934 RepID=UPI0025EB3EA4|nr:hypothetical protein [uncultured Campylobacter sp.]